MLKVSKIITTILAGSLVLSPLSAVAAQGSSEEPAPLPSFEAAIPTAPPVTQVPLPVEEELPEENPTETPSPTPSPSDLPTVAPQPKAEVPEVELSKVEESSAPEEPVEESTEAAPQEGLEAVQEKSADDLELDAALQASAKKVVNGNYVLPLASKSYWLSSYFGPRCPVAPGASTFHGAIDMAAPRGTDLYAITSGTVESVDRANGTLRIRFSKDLLISFGHIDNPTKFVSIGQKVSKGQKVAEVGNTGISNGPHLHLAIQHKGTWVDPLKFLADRGINVKSHATRVAANTPTSCTVYTTAKTGLKQSASHDSKTLRVLPKGTQLSMAATNASGFWKVKTTDGKTGYIHAQRASTHKNPNTQPSVSYGSRKANEKYSLRYSRHLFDYPGKTEWSRGIIETIGAKQKVTTTGRTSNGYTEVKWGSQKGWLALDAADKVTEKPKSVSVYRFWSPKFGDAHFYTSNKSEADKVRTTDKNWTYEGVDFKIWPLQGGKCAEGTAPIHRFWSSKLSSHLYTASASEAKKLRKAGSGWSSDGIVFCGGTQAASGTKAVHRFWSPKFKKYFYTANQAEAKKIRSSDRNWNYEGVSFYAPNS